MKRLMIVAEYELDETTTDLEQVIRKGLDDIRKGPGMPVHVTTFIDQDAEDLHNRIHGGDGV